MGFDMKISSAIFENYSKKFYSSIKSDVIIAGAGPSGLLSAGILAKKGLNVAILEKRLAPGGGIWGGAMGMPEIIVEKDTEKVLKESGFCARRDLTR
ncbi:MAG: FAD-dependent monooxygenase [Acidobacteria bacterium]|nr:FAD-dependent monooxygenase [Acidobacteriota bacterium]